MDLGFILKLLKETGQIEQVKIIGLPQDLNIEIAKSQIKQLTKEL